jgi:hypothetical protein
MKMKAPFKARPKKRLQFTLFPIGKTMGMGKLNLTPAACRNLRLHPAGALRRAAGNAAEKREYHAVALNGCDFWGMRRFKDIFGEPSRKFPTKTLVGQKSPLSKGTKRKTRSQDGF